MSKYEYQVQLTVTTNNVTKQIPTFILPEHLGLISFSWAEKVVKEMFTLDCVKVRVHGAIMDHEYRVHTF
jgi:hypothetical protein